MELFRYEMAMTGSCCSNIVAMINTDGIFHVPMARLAEGRFVHHSALLAGGDSN